MALGFGIWLVFFAGIIYAIVKITIETLWNYPP